LADLNGRISMPKTDPTPDDKLKKMLAFGTKVFAVPKAEYDEREAKRKKRKSAKKKSVKH
jgi:threonine dehydratase